MKHIQVILLDKVNRLGEMGELINVRAGYARNFLFPQGKAVVATKKNIFDFKNKQFELQEKLTKLQLVAKMRLENLNKLGSVVISSKKVGSGGKLFGSIGPSDIAQAITDLGVQVFKNEIKLPSKKGLRMVGDHEVKIHLYGDIYFRLIVTVISEA